MSAVLTREQVRERIDVLEALEGVMSAVNDTTCVEFEPGEQQSLDLHVSARDTKKSPVAFAHALPPDVVVAGLLAMRAKLEGML